MISHSSVNIQVYILTLNNNISSMVLKLSILLFIQEKKKQLVWPHLLWILADRLSWMADLGNSFSNCLYQKVTGWDF
jgi:hypothetical protein